MQQRDTICALATPPGVAGLAVIRISGTGAIDVVNQHYRASEPLTGKSDHTINYGWWLAGGEQIDAITATVFVAPRSYTGEDVVEVGCHGGQFVVDQILASLTSGETRLAEPGEFTRRAFLNGKLEDRGYADNTVWITFNIFHLLKEIGELAILDQEVPFNDGTPGTVYEHVKRSVDWLWSDRGELGLLRRLARHAVDSIAAAYREHVAAREDFGQDMAYAFANAQQSNGLSFVGFHR